MPRESWRGEVFPTCSTRFQFFQMSLSFVPLHIILSIGWMDAKLAFVLFCCRQNVCFRRFLHLSRAALWRTLAVSNNVSIDVYVNVLRSRMRDRTTTNTYDCRICRKTRREGKEEIDRAAWVSTSSVFKCFWNVHKQSMAPKYSYHAVDCLRDTIFSSAQWFVYVYIPKPFKYVAQRRVNLFLRRSSLSIRMHTNKVCKIQVCVTLFTRSFGEYSLNFDPYLSSKLCVVHTVSIVNVGQNVT